MNFEEFIKNEKSGQSTKSEPKAMESFIISQSLQDSKDLGNKTTHFIKAIQSRYFDKDGNYIDIYRADDSEWKPKALDYAQRLSNTIQETAKYYRNYFADSDGFEENQKQLYDSQKHIDDLAKWIQEIPNFEDEDDYNTQKSDYKKYKEYERTYQNYNLVNIFDAISELERLKDEISTSPDPGFIEEPLIPKPITLGDIFSLYFSKGQMLPNYKEPDIALTQQPPSDMNFSLSDIQYMLNKKLITQSENGNYFVFTNLPEGWGGDEVKIHMASNVVDVIPDEYKKEAGTSVSDPRPKYWEGNKDTMLRSGQIYEKDGKYYTYSDNSEILFVENKNDAGTTNSKLIDSKKNTADDMYSDKYVQIKTEEKEKLLSSGEVYEKDGKYYRTSDNKPVAFLDYIYVNPFKFNKDNIDQAILKAKEALHDVSFVQASFEMDNWYSTFTQKEDWSQYSVIPEKPDSKDDKKLNHYNTEEKQIYYYLKNTEGQDAADKWLMVMLSTAEKRYNDKMEGAYRKFSEAYGDKFPAFLDAASIGYNIFAALEYISDSNTYTKTGYMGVNQAAKFASVIREYRTNSVDWMLGDWDAFDFLYEVGMSTAESFLASSLPGESGGLVLGLSAAANATNDALSRGMRGEQAFLHGAFAGATEMIFESVSIGNLKSLNTKVIIGKKGVIKEVVKSMLVNASEENLTECTNMIYDTLVNADFSQAHILAQEYLDKGKSPEEAKKLAARDLAYNLAEATAAGFASGGVMGMVGSVTNYKTNAAIGKQFRNQYKSNGINSFYEYAKNNFSYNSDISTISKQYTPENITDNALGVMYSSILYEIASKFDACNSIADLNNLVNAILAETEGNLPLRNAILKMQEEAKYKIIKKNGNTSELVENQQNDIAFYGAKYFHKGYTTQQAKALARINNRVLRKASMYFSSGSATSELNDHIPRNAIGMNNDTYDYLKKAGLTHSDGTIDGFAIEDEYARRFTQSDSLTTKETTPLKSGVVNNASEQVQGGEIESTLPNISAQGQNQSTSVTSNSTAEPIVNSVTQSNQTQSTTPVTTTKRSNTSKRKVSNKSIAKLANSAKNSMAERLKNSYIKDGKQYISNGIFLVELNNVDETIPHNEDFPIDVLSKQLNLAEEQKIDGNYSLELDDVVEAIKQAKEQGNKNCLIKIGDAYFDAKYVEAVLRSIESPQISLSQYNKNFKMLHIVGENGQAIIMPVQKGKNSYVGLEAQMIDDNSKNFDSYDMQSDDENDYEQITLSGDMQAPNNNVESEDTNVDDSVYDENDIDKDSDVEADKYAKDPKFWETENKNDESTVPKTLKEKIASLFGWLSKNEQPSSISEIVKLIEKSFGVPISTGRFRHRAYGIYKNKIHAIRTKISNALPTIAHELGHHLDRRYGLRKFNNINEAIEVMKKERPEFAASYKPNQLPGEAIAEFIRIYLVDRTLAEKLYPNFYKEFVTTLPKLTATVQGKEVKGSEDLKKLNGIGDKINQYYVADKADAARSAVISRTEAQRISKLGVRLSDLFEKAIVKIADKARAIKKVSQKAYNLFTYSMKSSVRAKNSISGFYLVGIDGQPIKLADEKYKSITDEDGNVLAFKYLLADLKTDEELNDFRMYLIYKHGLEWLKEGKRVFADDGINNEGFFKEQIQKLEQENPMFKEISEKVYLWENIFMQEYAVKSGLVPSDVMQNLNDKYPFYVPFYRNVNGKTQGVKSGVADQKSLIRRAKGSGLELYDPLENIIVMVDRWMKAADRNRVMQEIANTADKEEGLGYLLEKVDIKQVPQQVSTAFARKNFTEELNAMISQTTATKDEKTRILESILERFDESVGDSITDFKIAQFQGKSYVGVMRNGKMSVYQVHDTNLLESVVGMNDANISGILKIFGAMTRMMKALTTGVNVVWSLTSNSFRDIQSAFMYSSENNPASYTIDYIKAVGMVLKDVFGGKTNETLKLYKTAGGGFNNSLSTDLKTIRATVKDIAGTKGFKEKIVQWLNIINHIESISDAVETAPRLAEFKRIYDKTHDAKKALVAAEEITVNFNRSGSFGKSVDQVIPYFNASVQGLYKLGTTLKNEQGNRNAFIAKVISGAVITTLLQVAFMNIVGDDGEEEYEKLSEYKKNNFYNFYIGDGKFLSIPKPKELGIMASFMERTVETASKEDADLKKEIQEYSSYVFDMIVPPMIDDAIWSTVSDVRANKDYKDSPIVSTYYESLLPKDQYNEKTSYLARWLGEKFNYSPMLIDYMINSNFGILGDINQAFFSPKKDITGGIVNKFITDSAYSTDVFNEFYENADLAQKTANSNPNDATAIYKNKQYTSVKSIVSALNQYGKDLGLEREYKIYARDYIQDFEKNSDMDERLVAILERTGDKDILYDKTFSTTYTVDGKEHKLSVESYLDYIEEYYRLIQEEYDQILSFDYSDERTVQMLKKAKNSVENKLKKKYKKGE